MLDPAPTRSEVADLPTPTTESEWLDRARLVRRVLETDAAERDRAGATPHDEVALLKDSGLVTVLGPREHGGAGLEWPAAYRIVREVAAGDGSIGQLLGYHYLWFWAARLVGTPEQVEAVEADATRNRWFFGGAVNPRDTDVLISDEGEEIVFRGKKSFSTGAKVSDVTVLEGVLDGTETHIFAIVPSDQPALAFHDDWDNIGQRLTESGGVTIDGVRVPWAAAAGFRDKQFTPRVYNTMNVPVIQLVFVNLYLGIARGALQTAAEYTRTTTRPWLHGGQERAVDEPYVLDTYGELWSRLWAAEALADAVASEALVIHRDPDALTERARGEHEVRVAAVKAQATDVALDTTSRIFEVTGARATSARLAFDRFWRNVRTHSLHDPVAYKRREVGAYVLTDELPQPTWYS
ncbi:acyl-CoA dehydrogenase family protein [Actinomycetospora sp.]|uniref:acyl-CoA dehydrogenase family protein n=1 Tax=Actinomycetospora sp. TaxID=1872135 RepID=UPI002F414BB7